LTGTYTCTNAHLIGVSGEAGQAVGQVVIVGFFGFVQEGTCDGIVHTWSATVFPEDGKFAGGKAMTVTLAFSCGAVECAEDYLEQIVMLRGGRR
jgi:hypothetical protein